MKRVLLFVVIISVLYSCESKRDDGWEHVAEDAIKELKRCNEINIEYAKFVDTLKADRDSLFRLCLKFQKRVVELEKTTHINHVETLNIGQ